ncbi:hypothetical protein H6G54_19505 [Anabaena cylindrica FACHB-243]|uniref:Uncharacterized protein n=2 Tax=Anabaena TaxID=1163 RepID=K9ZGA8_ANACC|nr:hypothetical protein [Anabaena sp. CCAP 1446/1C]AFZ58206.1 hypothetical protein Anacy_2771 [Anabaena cylindrica PCC 7122]MBD2419853.1 hypothetical protein [Anabaena cylindrica FACHB-243]MBY5280979.1 hypothetical protein [Anabaena sp. CCAP 1446/1C]MBY5307370.1 hypothetical protein [Anabaena sp. CCAP 1446/1C]BAY04821.1 hypothetical protein NIES19_40880 [Anabaena cylindrica PCC 7122]
MKRCMPLILIGFLLFVAGGDQVLPGALGKASTQTRTAMNNFALNLFPSWRPKTKPYERTEKEIQKLEKK